MIPDWWINFLAKKETVWSRQSLFIMLCHFELSDGGAHTPRDGACLLGY